LGLDGERILRICLLISKQHTNVTDGRTDRQTPHDNIGRAMHSVVRQKQEAQLLQRDRAVLHVIKYVTKSLKVIENGTICKLE